MFSGILYPSVSTSRQIAVNTWIPQAQEDTSISSTEREGVALRGVTAKEEIQIILLGATPKSKPGSPQVTEQPECQHGSKTVFHFPLVTTHNAMMMLPQPSSKSQMFPAAGRGSRPPQTDFHLRYSTDADETKTKSNTQPMLICLSLSLSHLPVRSHAPHIHTHTHKNHKLVTPTVHPSPMRLISAPNRLETILLPPWPVSGACSSGS